jgi:uncharacterized protein YcnI
MTMNTKRFCALILGGILAASVGVSLSAHIMVSPPDSKAGVTQKYELRVHNEEKVAITSVDLTIPDGIAVLTIGPAPSGTYTTTKTGDRITSLTWKVDVAASKYLALPFTAKNPDSAREVSWNAKAHLSDGTVVEWSDKPGPGEKASVTKIAANVVSGVSGVSGAAPAIAMQAAKAPMSDADFSKAMKDINPTFMSLQRANASMDHGQGVKDAEKLSALFKDVQGYFEAKKVDDAVAFAKSAVAAADATVKASEVMDMTSLTASQQKLTAACAGCHMAHRTRNADGTYSMK